MRKLLLTFVTTLVACLPSLLFAGADAVIGTAAPGYLIGRGMTDITGPAVGMQMWGFGRADQITEGIHIRQRSRAFVVAQADEPGNRLVFVSADLGSIGHHMTLEVVERLQQRFGDTYNLDNVILSATHTHSGPGGYWVSRNTTGLDGGFYPAHFDSLASGITASIVAAHTDIQAGAIYINSGTVSNAGVNRSAIAYRENPRSERDRYAGDTDTGMTLLKFVTDSGAIGMLNWYALHPTAMNYYNRLISGDHKGYASLKAEQKRGVNYDADSDFVAAFAQSNPGDISPNTNLDNTGPGETDVETTQIMGERQLVIAELLFASAQESLSGPIDTRRIYVDLSNYEVEDRFTAQGVQQTCPSAYGYSFAGGSTEDGGGHFLFEEGMREQSFFLDLLIRFVTGAPRWTEAVKTCQAPKPILFETGSGNPPLQSQVHPVTLARIGQLVILALPAEVTTMAARRLRETVKLELGDWAKHIVIAGYANGYAGYVTTEEEYMLQQYEAAHTLHGRWSLAAYRQVTSELAGALESGQPIENDLVYDDWRGKSAELPVYAGSAEPPPAGTSYGDALPQEERQYVPGEIISTEFWSTNPSADFHTGNNFMRVERQTPQGWQHIASDGDWHTRVRWRDEDGRVVAEVSWQIPLTAKTGQYRLVHLGRDPLGSLYMGVSEAVQVN